MGYDNWKASEPIENWDGEWAARELAAWRGWSAIWHDRYTRELCNASSAEVDAAYKRHIARIATLDPWILSRTGNSMRALGDRFASEYIAWLAEEGVQ